MLGGDRVEDAAHQRAARRRAVRCPGHQVGHSSRGEPDHLGADGAELALGRARIRSGVSSSERIVWRIFSANSSAPSRPSPSLRGSTSSRRWRLEARPSRPARARRRRAAAAATAATAASSASACSAARQRFVGRARSTPGSCSSAFSVWKRATGRPDRPPISSIARVDHRRDPLEPSRDRGEPVRQRRELPGDEPEQAAAEQVDPVERVPGFLAQIQVARSASRRAAGRADRDRWRRRRQVRRTPRNSASQRSAKAIRSRRPAADMSGHCAS